MTISWRGVGLVAQSLLYVAAGVNHFWHSGTYVAIMPSRYSHPLGWVQFTGAAEILGGLGLWLPQTRRAAAWCIIAMLVGYFDVHIDMIRHAADRFASIPLWVLYARLPLQIVLIAWAWVYTRSRPVTD
jgi:uncharacterized membrane protein